jgi:murein DD-endopeptidase MepM/ murein hydrolase activator NlpD
VPGAYELPAPTTRGVPNILLDGFRIPPFLLPIYQAAGIQYGVRWEILAAINSIETDYGRNLNVSSAGALGWMQFMPATWAAYGTDANNDGRRDPYNPVDAIFAAARYLRAAGAQQDLRRAIWAYNHADWYVNDVLRRAQALSTLPSEVVASLSGMTLGRFPVAAPATYAGRLTARAARARISGGNASIPVEGAAQRGRRIFAAAGSPVVAVQDARVVSMGVSPRLGRYVRLRDAYGNVYTYGHLAKLAKAYPVPRPRRQSAASIRRELGVSARDPRPARAATAGRRTGRSGDPAGRRAAAPTARAVPAVLRAVRPDTGIAPAREAPVTAPAQIDEPAASFDPTPLLTRGLGALRADGLGVLPRLPSRAAQTAPRRTIRYGEIPAGVSAFRAYFAAPQEIDRRDVVLRPLRRGAKVIGGTVLGRVGAASLAFPAATGADAATERRAEAAAAARLPGRRAPHLYFEVRPAGTGTPRIDPKPLLDGWRLLHSTAIYRARNPVLGGQRTAKRLTTGQIMLMSKEQLMRHVLDSPDLDIYSCGRADIRAGIIDRRVLVAMAFLAARGMRLTITSLRCGHSYFTASGNVSHHTTGTAFDIAAINGIPVIGNQGPGSITDKAVRALLTLQGTMKPAQIITLMKYAGTDNTLAMSDHHDHIHIGWDPTESSAISTLRPDQWDRLVSGLGRIRNPVVPVQPSRWSISVTKRPAKVASRRAAPAPRRASTRPRRSTARIVPAPARVRPFGAQRLLRG